MFRTALAMLALSAAASGVAAQQAEIRAARLPARQEWRLIDFFNDPNTRRLDAPLRIEAGETLRGDIGVVGGPVTIAGTVAGTLVVVNGDVEILDEGRVEGDLTVVNGEANIRDSDAVTGTLTVYGGPGIVDRSRRDGDEWDDDWDDDDPWPPWRRRRGERDPNRGAADLKLRVGNSYNRVEGLPLMFGPSIRTGGDNPLRIEALVIWRTESGTLDSDELGYSARLEQSLFDRAFWIGAGAHSVVTPIESSGVTDTEASLAAVILHDDYRDYYEREGWSAFLRFAPQESPFQARLELRDETHGIAFAGDPWTLFNGSDPWRLQPIAAEGDYRSLTGEVVYDTRDDDDRARYGTYARAWVEQGLSGDLVTPELYRELAGGRTLIAPARSWGTDFRRGFVDVRQHLPVASGAALGLRFMAGGSLDDSGLPPQFQHALGGPGTLPGFDLFAADCGARRAGSVEPGASTADLYMAYGCDRVAVAQIEYAGALDFDFGFGNHWDDNDRGDWDVDFDTDPSWVLFVDAAKGWALDSPLITGRSDTDLLVDAGVGFLIDSFGIYAAMPIKGTDDRGLNFFIRFTRRF